MYIPDGENSFVRDGLLHIQPVGDGIMKYFPYTVESGYKEVFGMMELFRYIGKFVIDVPFKKKKKIRS